ncbi:MAG TPA: universal stress protein, partial [Solirubrobacteraceae bacterium]
MRSAARRLLVGFDGTPPAVAALRHAVRLARRNHGLLVVAYVAPEHPAAVLVSPFGMCSPLPENP